MTQKAKAVWVDGSLYVSIAVCGFVVTFFSGDDVYKYVNPYVIFWTKAVFGSIAAGAGALKMFRSNTFAESQNESAGKEITRIER